MKAFRTRAEDVALAIDLGDLPLGLQLGLRHLGDGRVSVALAFAAGREVLALELEDAGFALGPVAGDL